MFLDEITIKLEAGRGGDGCTSFRHEKYVEMGGPDGGNGGPGGDIIFKADEGLKTLIDLKYKKTIKGNKGENGKGSTRTGAHGKDIIVTVPVGTTIKDEETGLIICDLIKNGEESLVAKGGKGGRGNASFKTNKNKAPKISEYGLKGEERTIKCELKLLADVGLVGFPSVGKSSLISVISDSKPKIADYHFTTLTPNLGVVKIKGRNSYVVADLPGIIEGASAGIGLGDRFLKHAERTKVIAYVLDMSEQEGRDVIKEYLTLQTELNKYSTKLSQKRKVIIANKMDREESQKNLEKFKKEFDKEYIIETSALTRQGLENLKTSLKNILDEEESKKLYDDLETENYVLYEFKKEKPYEIKKENDSTWVITGEKLETLLQKTRFNSDEAALKFASKLKKLGIDEALKELGAKDGDTVKILETEFTYNEKLDY